VRGQEEDFMQATLHGGRPSGGRLFGEYAPRLDPSSDLATRASATDFDFAFLPPPAHCHSRPCAVHLHLNFYGTPKYTAAPEYSLSIATKTPLLH